MEIARLNNYNSSLDEAFEALSVQLFQRYLYRTFSDQVGYFSVVNGAGGDGGVEAYAVLNDGQIVGVQAKYFLSSLTKNQLKQIEHSIRTAKEVRNDLKRYIVCLPRKKFSEKKGRNGELIKVSEERKVLSLAAKIKTELADLEIEFWFEDRLVTELGEAGNDGIKRFWFEKEEIAMDTLKTRFDLAKAGWLNERYVPDLHQAGKIAELIEESLFTDSYIAKEIASLSETKREIEEAVVVINTYIIQNGYFPEVNEELTIIRQHLNEHLKVFGKLLADLQVGVYVPIIQSPTDFDVWKLKLRVEHLPKHNLLRNITPKLVQSLEKVHQIYLVQYWDHLNKQYHPHNYSILGPVGTGKTHALANAVESKLDEGQAALIIRAKGTANESWGSILRQTLDCCVGWSDLQIFSGLEALAVRNSVNAASGRKIGEQHWNKTRRVLICVDGIDEADNWATWRERILECETWLKKFPLIRFIFSARSYPPMNMNPCDLPNNELTQLRADLPESGDRLLYDLVPDYFKTYKITYAKNFWIRSAFENALTLRLFCQMYAGQDIEGISKDPIHFTLRDLLNIKIERLEQEFRSKYAPNISTDDQTVRQALFFTADLFKDQSKLARDYLRNQLFDALHQVISKITLGSLLDMLSDHGFLVFEHIQATDGISPATKVYGIGIQSYSEFLYALKQAGQIVRAQLLDLPTGLLEAQMEYTRTLTAIILFNDFNMLVGENNLWTGDFNERQLLRLQFQVFGQSPDAKIRSYLDYLRLRFETADYTIRDLMVNEFIMPNLYRQVLNLGVEIVHHTLIKFPNTYQRDLFWSGPDHHDYIGNSALSLYLEHTRLYPFDHYLGKPLILAWSLSSVHKAYREKCRSELTDWAYTNIYGFIKLLDMVFMCGDEQICEDLSIVILGLSGKFTNANPDQRLLADWILKNVFSEEGIGNLTNSVVRYGNLAYMERIFTFNLCTQKEILQCRPPYIISNDELKLDFAPHELDSQFEGRYPIQDDLDWNAIDEAFDGFLKYEEGGLNDAGRSFMKPYIEKHGSDFNQHDFAVAAAISYIKDLGWKKNKGPANDGNSEWATFEEKYTWLAVHKIQGFLADRLPYGKFETEGMLDDYGKILHINNPVDFGVSHVVHYYRNNSDKWLLPEDIAEPVPLTPKATQDAIRKWATAPFIPNFKEWIEIKGQHLNGRHKSDDDWIALYSNTALPDPNNVGRARLSLNCVLIPDDELVEFKDFILNSDNTFDSNHGLRPDDMSASIANGVSHSLVDVVWMNKYKEEEPVKWITNQDNLGYQVKTTITEIHESSIASHTDIYQIPSLLLRKGLNIATTDKRGFFNAAEQLKCLIYKQWENNDTEQKITLIDRKSFEDFLKSNALVPLWITENFRSTISDSPNKKNDNHWQNCTKWIVWGGDYNFIQFHNSTHC